MLLFLVVWWRTKLTLCLGAHLWSLWRPVVIFSWPVASPSAPALAMNPTASYLWRPAALKSPFQEAPTWFPFMAAFGPEEGHIAARCQMHSLCSRLAFTRGFSQSFILRPSSTYFILPHTSSMCPQTQGHTSSVLTGLLMAPLTRLRWKASTQYPAGAGSRGGHPVPTTHHLDTASLGLLNINPSHPQGACWAKGHKASSWPSPLKTARGL